MLRFSKKFTVGVPARRLYSIKEKLDELDIEILGTRYHGITVLDNDLVKVYFECISSLERYDELVNYLTNDIGYLASIIL